MHRLSPILVGLVLLAQTPLVAQSRLHWPLEPGDRIRAKAATPSGTWAFKASVLEHRQDTLDLSIQGVVSDTAVALEDLTELDVLVGRKSGFGKGLGTGAKIGAAVGVVFGIAFGISCSNDDFFDCSGGESAGFAFSGAVGGAGTGALLGGLIGALSKVDDWASFPMDRTRLAVVPFSERIGVGLAFRF